MCDCKTQLEAKLTERFKAQKPESSDHKVTLEGYGIAIQNNAMVLMGFMPYTMFSRVPLKKGGEKPQKLKGTMAFSFCPFCGEQFTKTTQGAAPATGEKE